MDTRYAANPIDAKNYDTKRLREEFLITDLFVPDKVNMTYSHIDRIIVGGATPAEGALKLEVGEQLGTEYFLQRREMGIINIGGAGKITVDGVEYEMGPRDGLYIGMGSKDITFTSDDAKNPAKFYFNSVPAHKSYPIVKIDIKKAKAVPMGCVEECNKRTIYQFIHPDVLQTCQLLMGMTVLEPGSNWNTMPCHLHERRMEVYIYFDLDDDAVVFHLMGEPGETRHIVMRNEQAVISPSWSIHSGVGTKNYTFIWGMCGENQTYTDLDAVKMSDLK